MALFCDEGKDSDGEAALERLKAREEILEICYWYQGEGLGAVFSPQSVMPFLQTDPSRIAQTFEELVADGHLQRAGRGYEFTPNGKRKGARMFVETFTDFQQPGHGECQDGCCDGDEPCSLNPATGICDSPQHRLLRYVPPTSPEGAA